MCGIQATTESQPPRGGRSVVKMFLLPVLLLQFATAIASGQAPKTDPFPSNSSIDTGEIRTVPISDIDRIRLNTERNRVPALPNNSTQGGAAFFLHSI